MRVIYTTDEAVLTGLLNDYRQIMHRRPLSPVRNYVVPLKSDQQFTASARALPILEHPAD